MADSQPSIAVDRRRAFTTFRLSVLAAASESNEEGFVVRPTHFNAVALPLVVLVTGGCEESIVDHRPPACETIDSLCPGSPSAECAAIASADDPARCLEAVGACATECGSASRLPDAGIDGDAADDAGRPDAGNPIEETEYRLQVGSGAGTTFRPWRNGERVSYELGSQGAVMITPTLRVVGPAPEGFDPERITVFFWFFSDGRVNPFDYDDSIDIAFPEEEPEWRPLADGGYEADELWVPFGTPTEGVDEFDFELKIRVSYRWGDAVLDRTVQITIEQ